MPLCAMVCRHAHSFVPCCGAELIVRARALLKQQFVGEGACHARKHKSKRKRGPSAGWSEPSDATGAATDTGAYAGAGASSDGAGTSRGRSTESGDEARGALSSPDRRVGERSQGAQLAGGSPRDGSRWDGTGGDADDSLASAQPTPLADIVSFKRQNFLEASHAAGSYDTVLCLSVTKWVHLNWGDDGLLQLFRKMYTVLDEGGVLILEPQPWKSYKQNKKVSQTASENFSKIVIRPSMFEAYLVHQIGFRRVEVLSVAVPGSTAGFDRPILACYK
eukprot:jgi/Mesvir1/23440/Mv22296-RA.1